MREDPRQALAQAAAARVEALLSTDQLRWKELCEDAATDFQRACLEAALLAGHPPASLHAFADAIRGQTDAELAEACRPPPGDSDQDPLRAFRLNGRDLSPRALSLLDIPAPFAPPAPPLPPPPPPARPAPEPPVRLLDLTGGVGPPRYGNILDADDAGAGPRVVRPRDLGARPAAKPTEDPIGAAGALFGIRYVEQRVDGTPVLTRALSDAAVHLERGVAVPVVLGRAPGDLRRYAVLLQIQGEGPRRAFQLHDPFSNETVWVNHRDLAAARDLPLDDKSLRCITAVLLPR